jgi:cytochrome c peroxidase
MELRQPGPSIPVRRLLLGLLCIAAAPLLAADDALLPFSDAEVAQILSHGPWPPEQSRDPSNRVSGQAAAIDLGGRLFFDTRLSRNNDRACATCHVPERSFTDGKKRAVGIAVGDRNTPTLMNPRLQRWYGHDGAADSLWSQSLLPMLNPRELGSEPTKIAEIVRRDADFACRYEKAFGAKPQAGDDEAVMVNMGKALAAFQETLVSERTAFDDFRDALARGDRAAAVKYPLAAQRGLKIFIGKGVCITCHVGPNFTHGEFADIGAPFFIEGGGVDSGRHGGVKKLLASKFSLLGRYNDDASGVAATSTAHVNLEHRNFGEFKVPTLRNLKFSAPYMHDGSMATLPDVVRHYSELKEERLHADGTNILKPLHLSVREQADLVAFLESLTSHGVKWRTRSPHEGPACRPEASAAASPAAQ